MSDLTPPLTDADAAAGITGVHPIAELFPPLTPDEYDALCLDLQENGLQSAIVTDPDGLILDGLHRRRACLENCLPLRAVQNDRDPAKVVLSLNLTRRSLSDSQRAMIGIALYYATKENGEPTIISTVARVVGVSTRTMERAKRVWEYDDTRDKTRPGAGFSPQVRAGTLTLKAADERMTYKKMTAVVVQPSEPEAVKASRDAQDEFRIKHAAFLLAEARDRAKRKADSDRDLAAQEANRLVLLRQGEEEENEPPKAQPPKAEPLAAPETALAPEPASATFEDFKETTLRVTDIDQFDLCRRWFLTHMTERAASSPHSPAYL